jgi:Cu-Zn family superoxide dismutase
MHFSFLIPAVILFFASIVQAATKPKTVDAILVNAKNEKVGTATLTGLANGVKIDVDAFSLPPGKHAIHLHEKGDCNSPDFKSAGDHFNPTGKKHGFGDPGGAHLGDLPNLIVGDDGKVKAELIAQHVQLSDDPQALLKKGGTAIVIHQNADDDHTQPSGDAGGRIACAEIKP